jgi:hypothetical protein
MLIMDRADTLIDRAVAQASADVSANTAGMMDDISLYPDVELVGILLASVLEGT